MQCACAILSPVDFPAVQYFFTLSHERHPLHLSDFNKTWIISTDFQKMLKIKFCENLANKSNLVHNFSSMFISILYMFRSNMFPSSGEMTVSVRHLVLVTLGGWPSGMYTRRSSTQSDKYQVLYWYSYFSWLWAHSCPKHVENRNKHTRKVCIRLVLFKDYTRM
jgi:hypothetical protein